MHEWTGEEITALRKRLELTQLQFSKAIGVTNVYVNYLEKGKRKPSKMLCLLLDILSGDYQAWGPMRKMKTEKAQESLKKPLKISSNSTAVTAQNSGGGFIIAGYHGKPKNRS
jgi:transcriptional regulator with XRE-family HTH domain